VRERLRGEGVDARLGGIDRFTSVADALEAFQEKTTISELNPRAEIV